MNVGELRAVMDGLPDEMPVIGYWDSFLWDSRGAEVRVIGDGDDFVSFRGSALVIDVT